MKAVSVRQPWAAWIVLGAKDVENRTWASYHFGPLLIHASAQPDRHVRFEDYEMEGVRLPDPRLVEIERVISVADPALVQAAGTRGAIIGCVFQVGLTSRPNTGGLWFEGPYGWLLRNPIVFREPIPYKGRLGLFDVPDELVRAALNRPKCFGRLNNPMCHSDCGSFGDCALMSPHLSAERGSEAVRP